MPLDSSTALVCLDAINASRHADLRQDLFCAAVIYAQLRATWAFCSPADRKAIDAERTRAHNAFIDGCNILSRAMGKSGENNAWRDALTDDRKIIGDFACYLHLHITLGAR